MTKLFPPKINDFQFSLLTTPHPNAISGWFWRKQREQEGQRGRNSSSQPRRRAIEVVQMVDDEEGLVHNCTIFLLPLDVRNIDDQCRGPSIKEKDHLVG